MTAEELRELIAYLEQRVRLADPQPVGIEFDEPSAAEMVTAGFAAEGVHRLRDAEWWPEMVEEVRETADFCEPEDSPEQVLRYARDVIAEYIRKRFQP